MAFFGTSSSTLYTDYKDAELVSLRDNLEQNAPFTIGEARELEEELDNTTSADPSDAEDNMTLYEIIQDMFSKSEVLADYRFSDRVITEAQRSYVMNSKNTYDPVIDKGLDKMDYLTGLDDEKYLSEILDTSRDVLDAALNKYMDLMRFIIRIDIILDEQKKKGDAAEAKNKEAEAETKDKEAEVETKDKEAEVETKNKAEAVDKEAAHKKKRIKILIIVLSVFILVMSIMLYGLNRVGYPDLKKYFRKDRL